MDIPDLSQDFHKLRFVSLNKTNPEFCEYINTHFAGKTWMERLYDYKHNITEKPECACGCGNKVSFCNFYSGYHKYYGKHSLLHGFNKDKYDPNRILEPHEVLSTDGNWLSERKTKTNLSKFYEFINDLFTEFANGWKEKLYLYAHKLVEPHKCPVCGKYTEFISFNKGYRLTCSIECKYKLKTTIPIYNPEDYDKIISRETIKNTGFRFLQKSCIKKLYPIFYKFLESCFDKYTNDIYEWLYLYANNLEEPPKCPMCGKPARFVSFNHGYNMYCSEVCHKTAITRPIKTISDKILTPEEVLEMSTESVNAIRCDIIKRNYPKTFDFIKKKYKKFLKEHEWMEIMYMYAHNLDVPEKYHISGVYLKFHNYVDGYFSGPQEFPDLNTYSEWLKEPHIKYYFPKFYKKVCNKYKKFGIGWMEMLYLYAHGLKEPPKCPICRKFTTFLSYEYGYETFCGNACSSTYTANKPQTHEKFRNTCKKLYGVEHPMQFEAFKDKVKKTIHLNLQKQHRENSTAVSKFEVQCRDIVSNLGKVFVVNDRIILYGRELDLVLVDYKIAIECNGSYYHSIECTMNHVEKDTHTKKWRECFGYGIELISIWEDWNLEDIRNFLAAKFEGNYDVIKEYKKKWFPDLNDNEWPLDLGFPQNFLTSDFKKEHIREHKCIHGNKICYDSGVLKIS